MKPLSHRLLFTPPFLCAMIALILNDHLLKPLGLFPLIHSKLSNIAGLFAMPVLLFLPMVWAFPKVSTARLSWIACVAVGVVFSLWEASPTFHAWYVQGVRAVLGFFSIPWKYRATPDPTDLICLPMLLLSHHYIKRQTTRRVP